jgi:hypothetical protein
MRTLLKIAVVMFVGYVVISSLMNMKDSPYHGSSLSSASPTMPSDLIGKTFLCKIGIIGLFNTADALKEHDLVMQNDNRAVKIMVLTGRAVLVPKNSYLIIEDIDVWNALERFHVRGNPTSLQNRQGHLNPIPRSANASRNFPGIPESVSVKEIAERLAKLCR